MTNNEFSDEQIDAFARIFEASGLSGRRGTRYIFKSGERVSSLKSLYLRLNFPASLEAEPALKDFAFHFLKTKELSSKGLLLLLDEWCEIKGSKKGASREGLTEEVKEIGEETGDFIQSLIPVINFKSSSDKDKRILLLHPETKNYLWDIEAETYLSAVGLSKEELLSNPKIPMVYPIYNPYTLERLYSGRTMSGVENILNLNLYNPPSWRFVGASPKYGGTIKKLFEHVFPVEKDREFVLDWFHYLVTTRNATVLCLVGARGTGKGIILKDIARALTGEEHFAIAKEEVLTDKFNEVFNNRRLVFFDEVDIQGDRELAKFKALCNDTISMEKKGSDSVTIENYCSIGLATNNRKNFRVEPQERRFSLPRVTEDPITKIMTIPEVEEFCSTIKVLGNKELAEFGEWLLIRKPKYSNQTPYKGDYYFEISGLSMAAWKAYIIEALGTDKLEELHYIGSLLKGFKKISGGSDSSSKFPTTRSTIEEFLYQYRHDGIYRIGYIQDVYEDEEDPEAKTGWVIRVDPEYWNYLRSGKREFKEIEELEPWEGTSPEKMDYQKKKLKAANNYDAL